MGEIQRNSNKTETNVQHSSATTHTHKAQQLHTAVGAHRVCNGARTVGADNITDLRNNADERWRWGKYNKTKQKLQGLVSSVRASLPMSCARPAQRNPRL
jgi:hypothetical protein